MSAKKFHETSVFKETEKEWDKILAANGFKDAEKTVGNRRYLKQTGSGAYTSLIRQNAEGGRLEYFELISDNILITSFPKKIDEFVMTKFSEGLNRIAIVREAKALGISIHRLTVAFIIRRYEHIWGLRCWTAKERNLKSG